MEEILNRIIEIDKNAKAIVQEEKDKKKNIEDYIENQFKIKKNELDTEYKNELQKQKQKYTDMFKEKKDELDNMLKEEIEKVESNYRENEKDIINEIISKIRRQNVN